MSTRRRFRTSYPTSVCGQPPDLPLSVVYGGGGVYGIAFGAGVAHGLQEGGIPVHEAPALGTSAGSWVASILALGFTYDEVAAVEVPPIPTSQPNVLADAARSLFGEATHPLVSVSAFSVRGGRRGREILSGADHPLADLCAASSAAPRLLPSHVVDGRTFVDGGVRSATSVEHATPAQHVIVVVPMARGVVEPGGRVLDYVVRREQGRFQHRNPDSIVTVIRPTPQIARLAGSRTLDLFDAERAREVYPLARDLGARWGQRLRGVHFQPVP